MKFLAYLGKLMNTQLPSLHLTRPLAAPSASDRLRRLRWN